jgi:hypothetical protein
MVSVNTGKVLSTVTVQKTILSTADSATALKFFDQGTQAFEAEAGLTINEPGTYAVKAAVELGVVELIKEGERKGIWEFKKPVVVQTPTMVQPIAVATKVEVKEVEVKKEEVKVEPKNTTQYLNETAYVYADANEKSTKRWQLVKGTKLEVIPYPDNWYSVDDGQGHKGYVKASSIVVSPPEKSGSGVKEVLKGKAQGAN